MYAHEYKCHVLYNTQRSIGWGNMIGEECESDWSLKSHLVASTRVSSALRRRQRIDDHAWFVANMTRERLGYRLGRRLIKAREDLKAASAMLENLYTQDNGKGTKFTEAYFDIQLELQELYYRENR